MLPDIWQFQGKIAYFKTILTLQVLSQDFLLLFLKYFYIGSLIGLIPFGEGEGMAGLR